MGREGAGRSPASPQCCFQSIAEPHCRLWTTDRHSRWWHTWNFAKKPSDRLIASAKRQVALIPLTIGPIVGQSLVSILQSQEIPFLGSLTSLKINHNIHDETVSPHLPSYARADTRGNNYKLLNHSFHYDLHKLFFSALIVNT